MGSSRDEGISRRPLAAFVMGGGRGLGRAIAGHLAGRGASVGVFSRTVGEVEEAARAIREEGGRAASYRGDVLDAPGLTKTIARFAGEAGGLDALVCASGALRAIGPLEAVDPDLWWGDLETSLRGARNAIRGALPFLKVSPGGTIALLVGPGHAGPLPFATGYAIAQAALVRLAESLAEELAPAGIRVYAVHPGLVPTELTRRLYDSAEGRRWLPRFEEAFAEGKEVDAGVVAEAVAWLVEDRPEALNGRVVHAPATPTILEARLDRIQAEDLGVLRLR